MQAWNIKQLHHALLDDLNQCTTQLERDMAKAIGGKEIRLQAQEWAKVRKLTPFEVAIASLYGYSS